MGAVTLVQLPLGVNSIWEKCARFGRDRFWADRRGPLALSLVALPDPWLAWKNLEMPILASNAPVITSKERIDSCGENSCPDSTSLKTDGFSKCSFAFKALNRIRLKPDESQDTEVLAEKQLPTGNRLGEQDRRRTWVQERRDESRGSHQGQQQSEGAGDAAGKDQLQKMDSIAPLAAHRKGLPKRVLDQVLQ